MRWPAAEYAVCGFSRALEIQGPKSIELVNLLGITGGVGMGKSTAQSFLTGLSIPVVDTDQLARDLVGHGQPALTEIRAEFGDVMLDSQGALRRDVLATRVFGDPEARRKLESILHPRIRERWEAEIEIWRREGVRLGAVVIPLLFETNAASAFDGTVCVACSASTQLERLRARGWNETEIQQRITAQWPVHEKMAASDYVVWTDGTTELHSAQWARIIASF